MYEEVNFTQVVDKILLYHRDQCRLMHTDGGFSEGTANNHKAFLKAEAAREILVALKALLPSRKQKDFGAALKIKLDALYEVMFFDRSCLTKSKNEEE